MYNDNYAGEIPQKYAPVKGVEKTHQEELYHLRAELEASQEMISDLRKMISKLELKWEREAELRARFELENRKMLGGGLGNFEWLGEGDTLVMTIDDTKLDDGTLAQIHDRLKRAVKFDRLIVMPEYIKRVRMLDSADTREIDNFILESRQKVEEAIGLLSRKMLCE